MYDNDHFEITGTFIYAYEHIGQFIPHTPVWFE